MTNLTWERLPNGDRRAKQHPILLVKPYSRSHAAPGWLVKVPLERDANFDDGWQWSQVTNPTYLKNRGGMYLEGADYNEARALVAEHLDFILTQIPDDYGQPEPATEPAVVVEDCSIPSLPPAYAPVTPPRIIASGNPRVKIPVLLDYDYSRHIGWVDEWDSDTGRLVLNIHSPEGREILNGRIEPGSTGVLMGVSIRTILRTEPAVEAPR